MEIVRRVSYRPGIGPIADRRSLTTRSPQPPHPVVHRQQRHRAAGQQAGRHAQRQREVVLVAAMHNAHHLQHAEAAKGDQRNAFVGLFAPQRDGLRHKQRRIAQQPKSEENRDKFLHLLIVPRLARTAGAPL